MQRLGKQASQDTGLYEGGRMVYGEYDRFVFWDHLCIGKVNFPEIGLQGNRGERSYKSIQHSWKNNRWIERS